MSEHEIWRVTCSAPETNGERTGRQTSMIEEEMEIGE
jgi:hypothetical protein